MPYIGIKRDDFGVSEAMALYLVRQMEDYHNYETVEVGYGIEGDSENTIRYEQCGVTISVGEEFDLNACCFVDNKSHQQELTLESLMSFERYQEPLSVAGLVFVKFGGNLLLKKFRERYDVRVMSRKHAESNLNKDFRKIYEYFIEVVDSFRWGTEMQYPTSEKKELQAFLAEKRDQIQAVVVPELMTTQNFVAFAEEMAHEIGKRFEKTCAWYLEFYLPAFNALIDSIRKANKSGVGFAFCDFDFTFVTLGDLLSRAASTQRLPRLMIRTTRVAIADCLITKYRLEAIKLVKPILYFPRDWIGNEKHIFEMFGIKDVDYISKNRDFAIARTLDAAMLLARELLIHADSTQENVVIHQDCPNYDKGGQGRPFTSLPMSRENSQEQKANGLKQNGKREAIASTNGQHKSKKENEEEAQAAADTSLTKILDRICLGESTPTPSPVTTSKFEAKFQESEEKENCGDTATTTTINSACGTSETNSLSNSLSADSPTQTGEHPPPSFCIHQQSQQQKTNANQQVKSLANGGAAHHVPSSSARMRMNGFLPRGNGEEDVQKQVAKIFRPPGGSDDLVQYMGVPDKNFSLVHVFAASIVGHALGNADRTLKLQSLNESGCLIRIGPGTYDFEDTNHKFTSEQKASMHTFDMAPRGGSTDSRLSVAGIAFVLFGKRAIARIVAGQDQEKLAQFLATPQAKEKMAAVFRRIYKRLVQPMDSFFEHEQQQQPQLPLATTEFTLFHKALAQCIAAANADDHISSEQGISCFSMALYISMEFFCKLVQSLISI